MRILWSVLMAAVIVAAIALSVSLLSGHDSGSTAVDQPSPAVTVAPAPEVGQPSKETWAALLPRLEEETAATPSDVNLQRKLALAYYNLGRYSDAVTVYEALLKTAEDATLRSRLGNVLRDMGDAAGAEAAYRKAIQDDPALPAPYLDLAELLWRQGRDDEAVGVLERGLTEVPENGRATLEQGMVAIRGSGQ
jgi:tetratricopeptide (TPR) repeat protein